MAHKFAALTEGEQTVLQNVSKRAIKPVPEEVEAMFVYDKNFTICVLKGKTSGDVVHGIAKCAAGLDRYSQETGHDISFGRAVRKLLA